MGGRMLYTDNEPQRLITVAKKLGEDVKDVLEYVSRRDCTAIKFLYFDITKKTKKISLIDNKGITHLEDVNHSMWYIPANPKTIIDLLKDKEYKTRCHIVTFPTEEGMTEEEYVSHPPGQEIKATFDNLYISGHHARVLQQHVKAASELQATPDVSSQLAIPQSMPDDGRPKLAGILTICKYYHEIIRSRGPFPGDKKAKECSEWKDTIKPKLEASGWLLRSGNKPITTPLALEKIFWE